jgi:hypothetical protein
MANQVFVENSFINGLITEATGLNFPEKAVTETSDCIFDIDGSVFIDVQDLTSKITTTLRQLTKTRKSLRLTVAERLR